MADTVVIDACCLINLAAAGALTDWLPDLGLEWKVPEAVSEEAIYLRGWDDNGEPVRIPIELRPYIDCRLLSFVQLENDTEVAAYVTYAAQLDDGEAMAIAIAGARGWALATDDRKAISLAREAGVSTVTTAELIKRWADKENVPSKLLSETLADIREKARFVPGAKQPLYGWWTRHLPDRN